MEQPGFVSRSLRIYKSHIERTCRKNRCRTTLGVVKPSLSVRLALRRSRFSPGSRARSYRVYGVAASSPSDRQGLAGMAWYEASSCRGPATHAWRGGAKRNRKNRGVIIGVRRCLAGAMTKMYKVVAQGGASCSEMG